MNMSVNHETIITGLLQTLNLLREILQRPTLSPALMAQVQAQISYDETMQQRGFDMQADKDAEMLALIDNAYHLPGVQEWIKNG